MEKFKIYYWRMVMVMIKKSCKKKNYSSFLSSSLNKIACILVFVVIVNNATTCQYGEVGGLSYAGFIKWIWPSGLFGRYIEINFLPYLLIRRRKIQIPTFSYRAVSADCFYFFFHFLTKSISLPSSNPRSSRPVSEKSKTLYVGIFTFKPLVKMYLEF